MAYVRLGGVVPVVVVISAATLAVSQLVLARTLYGRQLYAIGRTYISMAVGWAHPTYLGVSMADAVALTSGTLHTSRIGADVFTFKIGVGF